jgi:hypothetical protein
MERLGTPMVQLSENDREVVEAFRQFVEDSVEADERYGAGSRHDRPDGSRLVTRFHAGGPCWFDVTLRPAEREVRVGFVTDDEGTRDGIDEMIAESGQSASRFIGSGFLEAGLDWLDPPVEKETRDDLFTFATPLRIEVLSDLDSEEVRDRVLRMLEGYLIAFGPALVAWSDMEGEEFEEDEDEDEDE